MTENALGPKPPEVVEEARLSAQRILNALKDPEALTAVTQLSIPHWFDARVLAILAHDASSSPIFKGIPKLEGYRLIETWADGSQAIISPVREAVIEALISSDEPTFRAASKAFAEAFAVLASTTGDVYDHIESVFHSLIASPELAVQSMLADGVSWKSEPLFAYDALNRLIVIAREQERRGVLPTGGQSVLRLLELFTPRDHRSAREEEGLLEDLLQNGLEQSLLFETEVLMRLGLARLTLGNTSSAAECFDQALPRYRELGSKRGEADVQRALGRVALRDDRLAKAETHFRSALEVYDDLKLTISATHCIKALAEAKFYRGHYKAAEHLFDEARHRFEVHYSKLGEANTRVVYAQLLSTTGRIKLAREHLSRAYDIYLDVNHRLGIANCLKGSGLVWFEAQEFERAKSSLGNASEEYRSWGSMSGLAQCQLWVAACDVRLGNPSKALMDLSLAREAFRNMGDEFGWASALREEGRAYISLGDNNAAEEVLQEALRGFALVGNDTESFATEMLVIDSTIITNRDLIDSDAVERLMAMRDHFAEVGHQRYLREAESLLKIISEEPSASLQL